jgi:hypothetical protein
LTKFTVFLLKTQTSAILGFGIELGRLLILVLVTIETMVIDDA